MKEFDRLVDIVSDLLGPNGCPWDQQQTLKSIRRHLIEEAYEVIEAINNDDHDNIVEELGDLFLNVVLLSKLGEKEKGIAIKEILNEINNKLIRRHPHVFGNTKIDNLQEVMQQWEAIKQQEKGKNSRISKLDAIPKNLPTVLRAQQLTKLIEALPIESDDPELQMGSRLFSVIQDCQRREIDADLALHKVLSHHERRFRESEE
ncbi:MAG: MazG family protein [Waddliaceae bacterium]